MTIRNSFLVLVIALAVLLAAVPLWYLFFASFDLSDRAWDNLLRDKTWDALSKSFILMALVAISSGLLGTVLAILSCWTDLIGKKWWQLLFSLPLSWPSALLAASIIAILGPRGELQSWLEPLGVDRLPPLYGLPGVWLVLTLMTLPLVLLPVSARLSQFDGAQWESSRLLGKTQFETFRLVVWPFLRPAIVTGMLLSALFTLSDFGAVTLMRYPTLTSSLFLQFQATFDRSTLVLTSILLVLLALGLALLARQMQKGWGGNEPTRATPQRIFSLGYWQIPALVLCGFLLMLALAIPFGTMTWWFLRGFDQESSWEWLSQAAYHSLASSFIPALAVTIFILPVVWWLQSASGGGQKEGDTPVRNSFRLILVVTAGIPSLVIALSYVYFGTRSLFFWYQTLALLIMALMTRFLPYALRTLEAAWPTQLSSFDEASRTLGVVGFKRWRKLYWPQLRLPLFLSFALVFLAALRELPIILLLAPPDYSTLASRFWFAYEDAFFARAGAAGLLLLVVASCGMLVVSRWSGK